MILSDTQYEDLRDSTLSEMSDAFAVAHDCKDLCAHARHGCDG